MACLFLSCYLVSDSSPAFLRGVSSGGFVLGRARSKRWKDNLRRRIWLLKRAEKRRMLHEAFWDREKTELVSLGVYPIFTVEPGEVLLSNRSTLHSWH